MQRCGCHWMQSFIGSSIQHNNNLCHCWGLMTAHSQHPVWLLGWLHGERNACRRWGVLSCSGDQPQRGPRERDLFLTTSCPSLYQELWQWKCAYCLHRDWWMKVLVVAGPLLYFLDLDGIFSFCIGETIGWKLSEANHHVQVRRETLRQQKGNADVCPSEQEKWITSNSGYCVCVHQGNIFLLANKSTGIYGEEGAFDFHPFCFQRLLLYAPQGSFSKSPRSETTEKNISFLLCHHSERPLLYYLMIHQATVG